MAMIWETHANKIFEQYNRLLDIMSLNVQHQDPPQLVHL